MPDKDRAEDVQECLEVVRSCAVFNLRKATRVLTQHHEREMRSCGILPTQFSLLVAVHLLGPVPVGVLAERLVMDRTTLSRNLKPLQEKGLVALTPSSLDQRLREVCLTEQGRERLHKALPCWRRAQEAVAGEFGQERLQRLLEELDALVDSVG